MNLNNDWINEQLDVSHLKNKPHVGMVDESYFDGSRLEAIAKFKIDMDRFMLTGFKEATKQIIDKQDWVYPEDIINKIREICPDCETCLLFWTLRTNYVEKTTHYELYYPVTHEGCRDAADMYIIDKQLFNLFFFCKMYTKQADMSTFYRMKMLRTNISTIASPPPPVVSIKNDGQMKILTDVIETVQDVEFDDGDKVLVLGSSSEDGVCAGMSYKVLSLMTDKEIEVDLYDPEETDMEYKIGTVKYKHHKEKYEYDGTEGQYKVLLDDIWIDGVKKRIWDPYNYYTKAKHYSIKWFPHYKRDCRLDGSKIKDQRYYTKGGEQRAVSHLPQVLYRREDKLGKCSKCNWFKYILFKDYDIEFYDYIMRMHNIHCVTKELRQWFGPEEDNGTSKWYEISDMELPKDWKSTSWDKIVGYPVQFVNEQTVRGAKFVFSNRRNVRSLIYGNSIVFVKEFDGRCYTNKEDINDLLYVNYDVTMDINLLVSRFQSSMKAGNSRHTKQRDKVGNYLENERRAKSVVKQNQDSKANRPKIKDQGQIPEVQEKFGFKKVVY